MINLLSGKATYQASGDRLRFRESLMPLFKPAVLSPKQIERRKKIRAKGRKHYIYTKVSIPVERHPELGHACVCAHDTLEMA